MTASTAGMVVVVVAKAAVVFVSAGVEVVAGVDGEEEGTVVKVVWVDGKDVGAVVIEIVILPLDLLVVMLL